MQLGIRLHDVKKAPLEERLAIAHEQGFKCAHLALGKVISEYSVADEALTPGYACYLRKLFEKNNLDIAVLGNYLNLTTPDEAEYQKSLHRYMAHIRLASLMNVGVVGTETGAVNKEYKYEEANHSKEALDLFVERLKPVVEFSERMGVNFAIEPVWKHIVCNPQRARYVLDVIGSPNLQIIFDPVNLLGMNNYEKRDEIFSEAMELLGPDISVVHIKDFVIGNGEIKSVAAGDGMMDYSEILKYMKKNKPFIHATLENTVPDNAEKSRKFIQGLYDGISI